MKTSARGIALIKKWEGLKLEAYQDIAGVWTIGYGHTASAKPGLVWTEQIAEAALTRDLESREDAVARYVTAPLSPNKFAALVSLIYNIGIGAFRESTVRKRINAGDSDAAIAEAWGWFNKATVGGRLVTVPGLVNRRRDEIALFLEPQDTTAFDDAPDTGLVAEPGRAASVAPLADHVAPSITAPEPSRRREGILTRLRRLLAPRTQRRRARRAPAAAAPAGSAPEIPS